MKNERQRDAQREAAYRLVDLLMEDALPDKERESAWKVLTYILKGSRFTP